MVWLIVMLFDAQNGVLNISFPKREGAAAGVKRLNIT
jgi:HSP20 family molecular chaperone IbpA